MRRKHEHCEGGWELRLNCFLGSMKTDPGTRNGSKRLVLPCTDNRNRTEGGSERAYMMLLTGISVEFLLLFRVQSFQGAVCCSAARLSMSVLAGGSTLLASSPN